MWILDVNMHFITVTAGQAEITAVTITSADTEPKSLLNTNRPIFFPFTGSQSQQYLHRDPITKPATSFPLAATQNGLFTMRWRRGIREGGGVCVWGGGSRVRERQIETLGPLQDENRNRVGRNRA